MDKFIFYLIGFSVIFLGATVLAASLYLLGGMGLIRTVGLIIVALVGLSLIISGIGALTSLKKKG